MTLDQRVTSLEIEVAQLRTALQGITGNWPTAPHGFEWPTSWRPAWITQPFRANPQNYRQYGLDGHEGLDVRSGLHGKCICIFDGVVSRVDEWPNTGNYGYSVRVFHPVLGLTSIYAHLDPSIKVPHVGTHVKAGQVLGQCGNTGNSSAAHLHLSIKDGQGRFVDPLSVLRDAYHAAGGVQELPSDGTPMEVKK